MSWLAAQRLGALMTYSPAEPGRLLSPERRVRLVADGTVVDVSHPRLEALRDAHAAGLFVHVWTLRSEDTFLSPSYEGDPRREYEHLASLGVDGVFTDFPDVAARVFPRD